MSDDLDTVDRVALARMFPDWEDVNDHEINTNTRAIGKGVHIERGIELCGSWHQQLNDGVRVWVAVHGEIECAPRGRR